MKTIDEVLSQYEMIEYEALDGYYEKAYSPGDVKEALVKYIEQLIDEINSIKSNRYSKVKFTYDNKWFSVKLNKEEILKLIK